jgi:hypothetical protein
MNFPQCLGRFRTCDGAPKGKRPDIFQWTCLQDLLRYRDEQLLLLEAGQITRQLFRTRVHRWARRWHEQSLRLHESAAGGTTNYKGDNDMSKIPQRGQGLHGEPMGKPQSLVPLTPTGDDVPDTPHQNLPPLED